MGIQVWLFGVQLTNLFAVCPLVLYTVWMMIIIIKNLPLSTFLIKHFQFILYRSPILGFTVIYMCIYDGFVSQTITYSSVLVYRLRHFFPFGLIAAAPLFYDSLMAIRCSLSFTAVLCNACCRIWSWCTFPIRFPHQDVDLDCIGTWSLSIHRLFIQSD